MFGFCNKLIFLSFNINNLCLFNQLKLKPNSLDNSSRIYFLEPAAVIFASFCCSFWERERGRSWAHIRYTHTHTVSTHMTRLVKSSLNKTLKALTGSSIIGRAAGDSGRRLLTLGSTHHYAKSDESNCNCATSDMCVCTCMCDALLIYEKQKTTDKRQYAVKIITELTLRRHVINIKCVSARYTRKQLKLQLQIQIQLRLAVACKANTALITRLAHVKCIHEIQQKCQLQVTHYMSLPSSSSSAAAAALPTPCPVLWPSPTKFD